MPRRIKLSWWQSRCLVNRDDGIRLRVEASSAEGLPDKIFAYQLLPTSPVTMARAGVFDHVCSPTDLEEYPEDAPLAHQQPAWFRLSYVDVLVRSWAAVQLHRQHLHDDVAVLLTTLNRMDDLEFASEEWVGDPPA